MYHEYLKWEQLRIARWKTIPIFIDPFEIEHCISVGRPQSAELTIPIIFSGFESSKWRRSPVGNDRFRTSEIECLQRRARKTTSPPGRFEIEHLEDVEMSGTSTVKEPTIQWSQTFEIEHLHRAGGFCRYSKVDDFVHFCVCKVEYRVLTWWRHGCVDEGAQQKVWSLRHLKRLAATREDLSVAGYRRQILLVLQRANNKLVLPTLLLEDVVDPVPREESRDRCASSNRRKEDTFSVSFFLLPDNRTVRL